MIRRSERGPRADTDGGKDPSIGSSAPPNEMESHLTSSETTTESQSTDSSDELTEPVTAEMSPSVSGSPGVEMGVSGNAIPVPEVEPEDPELNIGCPRSRDHDLSLANALIALHPSAPRQDLSHGQMPIGSPSEENVAVCTSMSVSAVPMSIDENMPVLVHAYAPIASPGQPFGVEPPRPTSDFQSIINILGGIDQKMQTVFEDARQRSVEMHDMVSNMENNTCGMFNDVERRMYERESHLMSEIENRTLRQQEVMQAYRESLRTQVTVMQTQVTREREEMQTQITQMERRLKDEFFSRVDSSAEATRPASGTLPVISSVESDVNECMHGANEASVRFGPRFDGSSCSLIVSDPPVETVAFSCADAAASEIGYNTYSTQPPPPRSGYGSWGQSCSILAHTSVS